jgi:hypothetical protein
MHHAMNTDHEWNKLGLELGSNICATTLEYNNTINTKRHIFLEMKSGFEIPPLTRIVYVMIIVKLATLEPSTTHSRDNNLLSSLEWYNMD